MIYCVYMDNSHSWWTTFWISFGVGAIIWMIFAVSNHGKFEGMTAEEWYYEYSDIEQQYTELKSCVEDYPYRTEIECL